MTKTKISPTQKTYELIQKLCKKYKVFPKNILQLGCGNGALLQCFVQESKVFGVDESETAIQEAKLAIPDGKFYHQELKKFRIAFSGQCILSLDHECNSLSNFKEREKIFAKAIDHLEPYGIFVCNIYTDKRYETHISEQSSLTQEGNDYIFCTTSKNKNGSFTQTKKIFTQKQDQTYILSESQSSSSTFPLTQIKKALQKYFEHVEITDHLGRKIKANATEAMFICQKGRK